MNTLNYFAGCNTAEQVKIEYRRLCKLWHPDLGTQEEAPMRTAKMQEINAAYAQASAKYRQEEMREKARQQNRPEPNEQDYADAAAVDEGIRQAIEQIITLDGLEIEICGLWVWVGGETKKHKEQLKTAGYRWSPKKTKWHFDGVPAGGYRNFTMDEIRGRYGSQQVHRRSPNMKLEVQDA
ncbi:MAG: J domain-containing protein [Chloroflexi bacterium]|nr:J domain-containing protein [Chloroflexota bacterium]